MIAVDNAREVRIGSLQNVVDVDALEVWSDVRLRLYRGETGETGLEACQETLGLLGMGRRCVRVCGGLELLEW